MIYSFYNSKNVPTEVANAQKEVFDYFNIDLIQVDEDIRHPDFIDNILNSTQDEWYIFFDVDAIPTRKDVIEEILNNINDDTLFGMTQADNCNNLQHNYAGPSFIAFTRKLWEKVGKPSFTERQRYLLNGEIHINEKFTTIEEIRKIGGQALCDVAEEFTYRVEEKGYKLKLWQPTSSNNKQWKLNNIMFGNGTTYNDSIYHQFQIRFKEQQSEFISTCYKTISDNDLLKWLDDHDDEDILNLYDNYDYISEKYSINYSLNDITKQIRKRKLIKINEKI